MRHQTSRRLIPYCAIAGLLLAVAMVSSGCRSEECARMMACCHQVKEVKGVGEACGPRTNQVDDPQTCTTIVETIGYMFEENEKELPEVCTIDG